MAKRKPNIKWGDEAGEILGKIIRKAMQSSKPGKPAQAVRVAAKASKQMTQQGKINARNAVTMAINESRGKVPKAPITGSGRMAGPIRRPPRAPSIRGRALPKTEAEKTEAARQGSRLLKMNQEPVTKKPQTPRIDPGSKARGSTVSTSKRSKSQPMGRSSDYEADQLRREAAADRRSMQSQPLRKSDRAARAEKNKMERHEQYVAKLNKDIDNAKHPKTREAAKQRKADYMKKWNAKNKPTKGRGGSGKSK